MTFGRMVSGWKMDPADSDAQKGGDADLSRSFMSLRKNGQFAEAFRLGRVQLERSPRSEGRLAGFIKDAYDAGLLDECVEFLVALVGSRSDDAELLNYTAGLLGEMGRREQSRTFAAMAAARQPLFPSRVKNARLHVLALQCIATADYKYSPRAGRFNLPGMTNLSTLLDPEIAVHRLLVDDLAAALEAVEQAPECDIVFNAISDPDYEESLRNAAALCDSLGLPVFNHPRRVRAMNRTSLPALLQGKSEKLMAAGTVFLPPGKTGKSDIAAAVQSKGFGFPVIVRAPGFQGGRQMALVRSGNDELGEDLYTGNGVYVIEFIDVSFEDPRAAGCLFYPKYRAFFVNGRLFPVHLFVADQFEVHRKTSVLVHARHSWLKEREVEFLQSPERHFSEGLWGGLEKAMASFGLDYFGVDFAVSARAEDDGRLVLFECNPAMRNGIGFFPEGSPVQRQWRGITLAAHNALCEKSGVAAWPYALKKGLLFSSGKES